MKRFMTIVLSTVMVLGLGACSGQSGSGAGGNGGGNTGTAPQETQASSQESDRQEESRNTAGTEAAGRAGVENGEAGSTTGKTLVVYYSATGHTKAVAEYIGEAVEGDLFELEPAEPYGSSDLNWRDENSRVTREHDNPDQRTVELKASTVENWEAYDNIFVGYPIWWGIAAWPVDGFIEANDFTGKTVIPFCTSSSSGFGESGALLAQAAGTGNWLEGRRFSSSATESDVKEWVESLKLQNSGEVLAESSASAGESVPASAESSSESGSVVYFTSDISPAGLKAVYDALEWQPQGKVAVKLSTGEPPASNYLDPELIKDLVQSVGGSIVECNTAYGGSRAETAMHMQVAKDHGFTAIAKVDILDEEGSMELPVEGGTHLSTNLVGSHFADYDSYIVLSHFKGHAMAGFGGAIKNISIGLGSKEGKCLIHTAGQSSTSPWGGDQTGFTESMAEAGKSVSDYLGKGERIVYINVLNNISIDCDCDGNPSV